MHTYFMGHIMPYGNRRGTGGFESVDVVTPTPTVS